MKNKIARALVETGFIIFLFYSNLMMGEFTRSGLGYQHGFIFAIKDVLTLSNFAIAVVAALIGYIVFEFLREMY